jgi:hypothetical protein
LTRLRAALVGERKRHSHRALYRSQEKHMKRKNKITIELPAEFIDLCAADGVTPETVLRGFIGDVSGIINWAANPRADGYNSNGSDEREMAAAYYERVGYPYWKRDKL